MVSSRPRATTPTSMNSLCGIIVPIATHCSPRFARAWSQRHRAGRCRNGRQPRHDLNLPRPSCASSSGSAYQWRAASARFARRALPAQFLFACLRGSFLARSVRRFIFSWWAGHSARCRAQLLVGPRRCCASPVHARGSAGGPSLPQLHCSASLLPPFGLLASLACAVAHTSAPLRWPSVRLCSVALVHIDRCC